VARRADDLLHVYVTEAGLLGALEQEVRDGVVHADASFILKRPLVCAT
jgi:hypothetical protein